MTLGRVVGNIVATIKEENFRGSKLMLVEPYDVLKKRFTETTILAVDIVDSGIGDTVLVLYEGGSARMLLRNEKNPCEAVIVGVVDRIDFEI
ncbi:MAG: hypothetical protein HYU64_06835 [Armatimonadetes bacterium]|nr:hypothetical protein [Armatimonadota bacterium]